ncbi:hypothetical protein QC761_503395 [Podospora bellae-mahoneyi]|uniref:Cyanovirin-N domain-containing protein n=1 Tax=Podospora bellae-mahoneyi TaxID=2093777 RepID=A0ABR0FCP2_9PEZI|nr:hypothetical protein QC761_503395 [Podospora bellae-mahoneyi]
MLPLLFFLLPSLTLSSPAVFPSDDSNNPSSSANNNNNNNNHNNHNNPTDLTAPTPEYPLPWSLTHSSSSPAEPDIWTDDPTLATPSPQYPLPFASTSNSTFASLASQARIRIGCTNNPVDASELENSLTCLSNWCSTGNTIPPRGGEFCNVGGSMMYICSYGGNNPCSANEMVTAWGSIQRDCGPGRGGWWFSNDWKKTYGIDSAGANVCGNL